MKRTYYNNGIKEIRLFDGQDIPQGFIKGRLKPYTTTKNCFWVNNGYIEKFIHDLKEMEEGFVRGRLSKTKLLIKEHKNITNKGRKVYTNGIQEIRLVEGDSVPEGFVFGRLPTSIQARAKQSLSHKGLHHTEETKRKISEHSNNNREKANQTIIARYGGMEQYYQLIANKGCFTKYKNKTFNSSKPEKAYLKYLNDTYGEENIRTNYRTEEYPFRCDFYVVPINKYIELNLHWTHGGKPFNKDDEECIKKLNSWIERSKVSKYYQIAIKTWTIRDTLKLETAKRNHLNYEVIYTLDKSL